MLERHIQEIRCREKVIRIFPNEDSAWRLVGALLAEKHEEWPGRPTLSEDGRVLRLGPAVRPIWKPKTSTRPSRPRV